jgi:hypothetical protein
MTADRSDDSTPDPKSDKPLQSLLDVIRTRFEHIKSEAAQRAARRSRSNDEEDEDDSDECEECGASVASEDELDEFEDAVNGPDYLYIQELLLIYQHLIRRVSFSGEIHSSELLSELCKFSTLALEEVVVYEIPILIQSMQEVVLAVDCYPTPTVWGSAPWLNSSDSSWPEFRTRMESHLGDTRNATFIAHLKNLFNLTHKVLTNAEFLLSAAGDCDLLDPELEEMPEHTAAILSLLGERCLTSGSLSVNPPTYRSATWQWAPSSEDIFSDMSFFKKDPV